MKFSWLVSAQALLYLTACASPSKGAAGAHTDQPGAAGPVPAAPAASAADLGDVARDYAETLAELADCRSRHRALADAVSLAP